MNSRRLWTVAGYEMKLLRRDWTFKFLVVMAVVAVCVLQLRYQSNLRIVPWPSVALTSSIPYANAYLIHLVQLFFSLFLAGRFLFEKRSASTMDCTRVRPYSNVEFLWGKVLGFFGITVMVDVVLMGIALFIHLFASSSPFALCPYLFYFFTLTLPTLVFATGLALLVKSVARSQALSIVILGLLFYLNMAFAPRFLHGVLDLLASSLPNAFSEWTGFSGLGDYLLQRGAFLAVGIGMLCIGVGLQRRLDDRPAVSARPWLWGTMAFMLGCVSGWEYYRSFEERQEARAAARALFIKHDEDLKAEVTDHHVRFQQAGGTFSAESRLTLVNPHGETLSPVVLYLNPGLEVQEVWTNHKPVQFDREGQILLLQQPLPPGDTLNVQLRYAGGLTQSVCYAEYERDFPDTRRHSFFRYGKEMFFLRDNFTLLTPEVMWYPMSRPTVNVRSPHSTPKTFTRFTLEVVDPSGREVLSQGIAKRSGDTVRFTNPTPLPGLSLCMGHYTRYADTINQIPVAAYVFQGHEYFFEELNVARLRKALDGRFDYYKFYAENYPFSQFAVVEIPVHYCYYPREWRDEVETLQPEFLFCTERNATHYTSPHYDSVQYNVDQWRTPERIWVEGISGISSSTCKVYTHNIFAHIFDRYVSKSFQVKSTDCKHLLRMHHPQIISTEFIRINEVLQHMFNLYRAFRGDTWRDSERYSPSQQEASYLEKYSLKEILQDSSINGKHLLELKCLELSNRLAHQVSIYEFQSFVEECFRESLIRKIM